MRAFLYDFILGLLLILVMIGTFAITSCNQEYTKPPVGWNATASVSGTEGNLTAGMAGSLEAGVFSMDTEAAAYLQDSEFTLLEFRSDFLLFYSIDLYLTITCDMQSRDCSACVYIPRVWPTEICYDNE
jgi:hypothetical protein